MAHCSTRHNPPHALDTRSRPPCCPKPEFDDVDYVSGCTRDAAIPVGKSHPREYGRGRSSLSQTFGTFMATSSLKEHDSRAPAVPQVAW